MAVKDRSKMDSVEHFLHDYLLAGESATQNCKKMMSVFRGVCDNLGVLLAEEKTEGPTCVLVYLGLVIDTIEMVIRIPENKLEEVKSKLLSVCNKHMVTLHDLQSLMVSLNFCSRAIPVLVPLICVLVML